MATLDADLAMTLVLGLNSVPSIRFALSEGGTGWIPYFVERLDREVFREHFLTCFITDPVGLGLRHQIGIDSIAGECDYPHSDSTWPIPAETLLATAPGVPDDELDKVTYQNACRWYSFDLFAHIPKELARIDLGDIAARATA